MLVFFGARSREDSDARFVWAVYGLPVIRAALDIMVKKERRVLENFGMKNL